MPSNDRHLDRYEIIERIASGGMAEVFRAVAYGSHGFEKPIAIKRILPRFAASEAFQQRFIREAKLAATLSHANIVQVLDFGRLDGGLFLAMEHVDGPDLAWLLRQLRDGGALVPVPAAIQIALEVCKGLDFAHERGVVHRDISPSNILLSVAGEVKIADFGIAHAADFGATFGDTGSVLGKWPYMSPEQTRGDRLDARSDLFSSGAVLYELFTGTRLFDGGDIDETAQAVRSQVIPPASERRPELPRGIDRIIARAVTRELDERYQRAADLVRDLSEVCYESRLVPTAKDVAQLVAGRVRGGRAVPSGAPAPDAADDADAFVERALRGVGIDRARETVRERLAGRSGTATETETETAAAALTATFVRRPPGRDGLSEWLPTIVPPSGAIRGRTVGALVALAIAAAAALVAVRPDGRATGAPVEPAGDPALAGARAAATPSAAGASASAAAAPVPAAAAAVPAAAVDAGAVDASTASPAAAAAPGPPRPAARSGRISIHVAPWADIYFRGKRIAETPPRRTLVLPVGAQSLTLFHPKYGRRRVRVRVPARGSRSFAFDWADMTSASDR
jgi:serine/threonine-protein kinase